MSELPDAIEQNPECGCCHGDTHFDGDCFTCWECQLSYDPPTLTASFLDPEVPACGSACDNYWHGDNKIREGQGFACGTCLLPSGHTSMCWRGCLPIKRYESNPL